MQVVYTASATSTGEDRAGELLEAAHQVCPYSTATRGDVDVTLTVA